MSSRRIALIEQIYKLLQSSEKLLTSDTIANMLNQNNKIVRSYMFYGYKRGIFGIKPSLPAMHWYSRDINHLRKEKPLIILDLDHQSHLLKQYANQLDIELWCFHGPMYSGKKAGTCYTTSSLYKESCDYLIGIVLTDHCVRGKLGSQDRLISIVTKDTKLANIREIFRERYGRTIEIRPV